MSSENSGPSSVRHVFDGIEELDNKLPNWWLGILWGTILFAFGYWFYYQPLGMGPGQLDEYAEEKAAHDSLMAAVAPKAVSADAFAELAKDPAVLSEGQELFKQNCASCHGAEAQGLVGPNLTDRYFIHGAGPDQIQAVIAKGKLEKGMPAWEPVLGPDRTQKLTAFVVSLKGKNLPGKEPQGEPAD